MIYIGIAIVIATILVILDRNHVFPQAWSISKRVIRVSGKVAAILVVAILLIWGVFLLLDRYHDQQAAKNAPPTTVRIVPPPIEGAAPVESGTFDAPAPLESAKRQAAQREEHAKKIEQIKIGDSSSPPSIRVTNGTNEMIRSITFGVYRQEGQQPEYTKIKLRIEPGKFLIVHPNDSACSDYTAGVIPVCEGILGLDHGTYVIVKDFEGWAQK